MTAIKRALERLTRWNWTLLVLLAIPAFMPFVTEGLPRSFDGATHLLRIGRLDEHIRSGALFPHWIPELLLGHGYPLFNYYAPSTYYLVELLHLLGIDLYYAFILAFCTLALAGALGVYLLALDIYGKGVRLSRWAALVAAVAYLYSPYLLTNIYIRGAIAEVGALALLPWIFWSVRRLFTSEHPERYVLPVAVSLGGLALTHNITLLFVPPVLIGYMMIHWLRTGRDGGRFGWAMVSLLVAMGVSAFFWLPLILDRSYLSERAYLIAKHGWLPMSMWTWENAFDVGFAYAHAFEHPLRIGLMSVVLAVAGFLLAGRRDAEWIYLFVVALLAALFGGKWALPIWISNDILPIAQFPWRLLSIITLFMSVLTGGILLRIPQDGPRQWYSAAISVPLIGFIMFSGQPRLEWIDIFSPKSLDVSTAVAAQLEIDRGIESGEQGKGISSIHEFRPRWAGETLTLESEQRSADIAPKITLQTGNAFDLHLTAASGQETPLRFQTFYFPGWEVWLDDEIQLDAYPSTSLGLLTVDLPAGEHTVSVRWAGTPSHRFAGIISLSALGLLAWLIWRQRWIRGLAAIPLIFAAFGLVAAFSSPPVETIKPPAQPLQTRSLTLLGYRLQQDEPGFLTVYPYWQVTEPAPFDLQIQWQAHDRSGNALADFRSLPFFNAVHASNWPVDAVVDDAYRIPLPSSMAAGTYRLSLQLQDEAGSPISESTLLGEFVLSEETPAPLLPANQVQASMGEAATLIGYDVEVRHGPTWSTGNGLLAIQAGSYLEYSLAWNGQSPVDENYHAFVHLIDHAGNPVAQEDHLPGPRFQPPRLWNRAHIQPDVYLLRIPEDSEGGLYQPLVGMYQFGARHRLPVFFPDDDTPQDDARLALVKIVQPDPDPPAHKATARFGALATLIGYDLDVPDNGFHAGDSLTLSLHFRVDGTTPHDYTRFVQVYDPGLGMIAQYDSLPQDGGNPTWSWLKDEIIVDRVKLQIAEDAQVGTYPLYVGFYDRAQGDTRLPVTADDGTQIPASWYPLTEIMVTP